MKRRQPTASAARELVLRVIATLPIVRAITRGPLQDRNDLAQETAARCLRRYGGQSDINSSLLRRVATNVAIDHYRRERARGGGRSVPLEDAYDAPALAYPADQESALLLKQVILGLPPLYRDVFILNRFMGLTYAEIAAKYGLSVKAVEYRMHRALALCEEALRD